MVYASKKSLSSFGSGDATSPAEIKKQQTADLDILMDWVTEQLASKGNVPRVSDVVQYAYTTLGYRHLKPTAIAKRLRLHPAYVMSSSQTRGKSRWKRHRPILTNTLGMLHGDLGFFAKQRHYETPVTFQAGYLVLKDVLSRFTYVAILNKSKSADAIIRALEKVLESHRRTFGDDGHRIKSIAFDRETSVMSNKVQDFLAKNNISFHAFRYTASKSKMAEGAIKLIRTTMARLLEAHPGKRWWQMLDTVVDILNSRPIRIGSRTLPWAPKDINIRNLEAFRQDLLKADPLHYFSQFDIDPRSVNFKYPVGTIVRPKLITTSSAVVGEKRSEVSLEADAFRVTQHIAYVNARYEVGRAYRCVNLRTREEDVFDEQVLAESIELAKK